MKTRHWANTYLIEDDKRCEKLADLFVLSVKNDISKWTQTLATSPITFSTGLKVDCELINYHSPIYNGTTFEVQFCYNNRSGRDLVWGMVYIDESVPAIPGQEKQIFADWSNFESPPRKIRDSLDALRNGVYEDGITRLETAISQKDDRKNKLEHLELEEFRSLIDESLVDWKNSNQDETFARQIARTAYGFNKNRDLPYSEWIKKFADFSVVVKEIKKLQNYKDD